MLIPLVEELRFLYDTGVMLKDARGKWWHVRVGKSFGVSLCPTRSL